MKKTYYISNMICDCCVILLKERLERTGIRVWEIKAGELEAEIQGEVDELRVQEVLNGLGMKIIRSRDDILVEKIKHAVRELIYHLNNVDSVVRKSDYLVERLGMSYYHLSKVFSKHESITLEKYIIQQKIERTRQLIDENEFTLSEIAYMMDYSSVQYLSAQFKSVMGITPTEYKGG